MGVLGVKVLILSYDISFWLKTAEASLKKKSLERLDAWEGDLPSLEGDELPRSLYVWVSVIEERR